MAKKKSYIIKTEITVREAWLIHEALEISLKNDRDERNYTRMGELAKLSDEIEELWGDNIHHDQKETS